ncbi:MAG TPA: hypothetical protein PKD61_31120, partial [Polyangiaceae bacterium]|nr:hypothetical protein [Polyangiaceae bacterium]
GVGANGGNDGGGGVPGDAALPDASQDAADAEAGSGVQLYEQVCKLNDNRLLLPGRTLNELAFAHPFVRIVSGDNAPCCYQGRSPTFIAGGAVGLDSCAPVGGVSIAGNREVTWHVPKAIPVETFEATCSSSYYVGTQPRTFAEHAFPGKSVAELSAVHALVHQNTPAFVYTSNSGDTEFYDQRPGQMFLRDGSVAVMCGAPEDKVTFVVPTVVTSPASVDVPCDAGIAEQKYPGATLFQLAAVRAVRYGLDVWASVGTASGVGDLYQADIADRRVTLDDGSWTKKTPFVSVECQAAASAAAIAGPVTFVTW